jgi:hypothetical protein
VKLIISRLLPALVYGGVALYAWMIYLDHHRKSPPPPPPVQAPASVWDLYNSSDQVGHTFLINRQTGAVWRYFRNVDDKGKITGEGFISLR